jgi:hypothetical protein
MPNVSVHGPAWLRCGRAGTRAVDPGQGAACAGASRAGLGSHARSGRWRADPRLALGRHLACRAPAHPEARIVPGDPGWGLWREYGLRPRAHGGQRASRSPRYRDRERPPRHSLLTAARTRDRRRDRGRAARRHERALPRGRAARSRCAKHTASRVGRHGCSPPRDLLALRRARSRRAASLCAGRDAGLDRGTLSQ